MLLIKGWLISLWGLFDDCSFITMVTQCDRAQILVVEETQYDREQSLVMEEIQYDREQGVLYCLG